MQSKQLASEPQPVAVLAQDLALCFSRQDSQVSLDFIRYASLIVILFYSPLSLK